MAIDELSTANGVILEEIGVAVIDVDPDQHDALQRLSAEEDSSILAAEPERPLFALASPEYLRGYRDGVTSTIDRVLGIGASAEDSFAAAVDESRNTWGLQATGVINSNLPEKVFGSACWTQAWISGIRISQGRSIVSKSFVQGAQVQDGNGHGTHTAGTSCGPATPASLPRYGIASGAQLHSERC